MTSESVSLLFHYDFKFREIDHDRYGSRILTDHSFKGLAIYTFNRSLPKDWLKVLKDYTEKTIISKGWYLGIEDKEISIYDIREYNLDLIGDWDKYEFVCSESDM